MGRVVNATEGKIIKLLIGNKIDLENNRAVSTESGEEYAKKNNMLFIETSALDATNIEESFSIIIKEICENYNSDSDDDDQPGRKINAKKQIILDHRQP